MNSLRWILICPFFALSFLSSAQDVPDQDLDGLGLIMTDPVMSFRLLEPSYDLRKVQVLMRQKEEGRFPEQGLRIGGALIAIGNYQQSSHNSKFAYLMRHPTSANQIGTEVSEFALHSFQVGISGGITNWLSAHTEILYDPMQSFGAGTITALGRNQLQLRRGFLTVGDLNKRPYYFALGKMDVPFGRMGSVNAFTNSTVWHAFAGLAYGAQVGFKRGGLDFVFMGIQGGTQFRAVSTMVGDSTNVPSQVNNFSADLSYTYEMGNDSRLTLGGSYLKGSAYNHAFPVFHFDPGVIDNPAVSGYGRLELQDRLIVKGSYQQTMEVWPGTFNPTPPLDAFEASGVSSKEVGASYRFAREKEVPLTISAEFSDFVAGPDGAPWERQNQYILGLCGMVNKSSKLFVELFRTEGYVPLNFVSGSAPFAPFPPGTTHSQNDVITHGIVVGGMLVF